MSTPTTSPDEHLTTDQTVSWLAVGIAVLAILLGIFAVGRSMAADNNGEAGLVITSETAAAIPVSLNEFTIDPTTDSIPADSTLVVANDGAAPHNVQVREAGIGTRDLDPGESAELDLVGLAPGSYEWFCSIAGHEGAGMTGTFDITATPVLGVDAAEALDGATSDQGDDTGYMTKEEADAKEAAMMASLAAFPATTEGLGAQVMEPTVLDDGTKLFELTVDEIDWEIEPGKVVKAMAYNEQIPGPTIKIDLGDRYIVRVTNELDNESTTLHPHGVNGHELRYDGVAPITQDPIRNGETFDYVFEATEPSLGMYHSHAHSLHQVPDGLAGAIIAGDYAEATGQEGVTQEIVMITNDAGAIGFSLNGKSFPATAPYVAQQGDRVMVHYMNEGLMAHPMHLHGQTGWVVAKDGFPLPQPYRSDTINVAPGERYTVVYDVDEPGTWVWHCHILSHVKRPDGSMFGMLTALIVEPAPDAPAGAGDGGDLGSDLTEG
jgi:FtsP/CotA-like multicopper oxidase with cupredoxin domain